MEMYLVLEFFKANFEVVAAADSIVVFSFGAPEQKQTQPARKRPSIPVISCVFFFHFLILFERKAIIFR